MNYLVENSIPLLLTVIPIFGYMKYLQYIKKRNNIQEDSLSELSELSMESVEERYSTIDDLQLSERIKNILEDLNERIIC